MKLSFCTFEAVKEVDSLDVAVDLPKFLDDDANILSILLYHQDNNSSYLKLMPLHATFINLFFMPIQISSYSNFKLI